MGTYDGYVDEDGAELWILEVTDGGFDYVYDIVLEDTDSMTDR